MSHKHKYHDTGKFVYLEYSGYQFHHEQKCKCGRKRLRKGKRRDDKDMNEQNRNYALIGHRGENMLDTGLFDIWIKWFFENEKTYTQMEENGVGKVHLPNTASRKM